MSVRIRKNTPIGDQFAVQLFASRNVRAYLVGNNMLPALVGTGEGGKT